MSRDITFQTLSDSIFAIHESANTFAKSAINQALTLRNWLIGCYIVEYEQKGKDRAEYGSGLLKKLEEHMATKGLNTTLFKNSRRFYLLYPQVGAVLMKNDNQNVKALLSKSPMASDFLEVTEKSPTESDQFGLSPEMLIGNISFSHICELLTIEDKFERFFYELETIKCRWSVKELRRQITTNLYVRAGISEKPELLLDNTEQSEYNPIVAIKDPYVFEFLELNPGSTINESDVEKALMDHLEEFMLELGRGFCFEARHKRILIDDEYYFPDLVFYNRILHCSVIVELKDEEFSHENFGQLNAYVGYYKENEMHPGDNPPVGILLCTKKGKKMVEYALSGMDNQLFASTYMLHLPDKKQLEDFLTNEMKEMGL